jgi:hypothetical protein
MSDHVRSRPISIRTVHGDVEQITASCVGHFGIHEQLVRDSDGSYFFADDAWQITHLPSGVCFQPIFPTKEAAVLAAREIEALRDDWPAFDPNAVTKEFLAALRAIYREHGGMSLPPPDGDRPAKMTRQHYDTDLNGYAGRKQT